MNTPALYMLQFHVTFKVPIQGYGGQYETNEREGSINLIRRVGHCSSRLYSLKKERTNVVPVGAFLNRTERAP